jgi:hypothetical protein
MKEDCNLRLQRLEITQQLHAEKIGTLEKNGINILAGLNNINKTMLKTKTAVYTIAAVLIVQRFGLFETIKLMILK